MSKMITASPILELADPIDRPLTPSAFDDEFENNTLDPSWTRVGNFDDVNAINPFQTFTGTGNRWSINGVQANGRKSWYMVQSDIASGARLRKPITFPSEYVVMARLSFGLNNSGQTNNDSNVRIMVLDPASPNDFLSLCLNESDGNVAQVEYAQVVGGVTTQFAVTNNIGGGTAVGQCAHVVAIQRISATYHAWTMSAAGNWLYVGSGNYTGAAPTHVQLQADCIATSFIGGFDYFRYRAGRFLP